MTPAIIESPFRGADKSEEQRNRAYLAKAIRWCVLRNYTPYASHKMLTDSLDDSDPSERIDGIQAGLDMAHVLLNANERARVFFFTDYGTSGGMTNAKEAYYAAGLNTRIETVEIGKL
jgi:hypothetical protein